MHLKIVVLLIVLVCSTGLCKESRRKKKSSSSDEPTSESSSSSESSQESQSSSVITVRCPEFCNPDNGYTLYTDTTVGTSVATFGCLPDYELSDNENRTCEATGAVLALSVIKWFFGAVFASKGYPFKNIFDFTTAGDWDCVAAVESLPALHVRCPNLCNPNNGAVDFNDTTVGFVATYTCNEGFTRNGPANRDCQENGTWSHSEPICMPDVTCPCLHPPSNGFVYVPSQMIGSTAYYHCRTGFERIEQMTRECKEDGTWFPALAPTCHPVRSCKNRWYMVYENDDKGTKLNGDFATLVKALTKGAEIRVRLPFYGVVAPLQNVRPVYFSVCGQIIFNMEKNGYDRFQDPAVWRFQYVCASNDIDEIRYNYGEYVSPGRDHTMNHTQWFIRERCGNKPLWITENGPFPTAGSVVSVISAVKSGQGIRVVLNTNEHVVSVDNIEYNAMEDDFAAMDIWRITAGWEYVPNVGGHHVFSNLPLWSYSLYSWTGMKRDSFWRIGEHVNEYNQTNQAPSIAWYTDPCWDFVYKHDENGIALNGSDINNLRAKASSGHRIKIMHNRTLIGCDEVLLKGDHVCCTCFNKLSKTRLDEFPSDVYHTPEIACTNGWINRLLIKVGSNEMVDGTTEEQARISWFADDRPWKKVASISSSGVVTSGSKDIFKYAVENGADVRYKVKFSNTYYRIVTPDHIEINGNNWGAMHIRSISLKFDNDLVLKYQNNPYMWCTIMSDMGQMDKFRWTLGEHQPRGHNINQHAADWFVNH